jgi:hypothetical protein
VAAVVVAAEDKAGANVYRGKYLSGTSILERLAAAALIADGDAGFSAWNITGS